MERVINQAPRTIPGSSFCPTLALPTRLRVLRGGHLFAQHLEHLQCIHLERVGRPGHRQLELILVVFDLLPDRLQIGPVLGPDLVDVVAQRVRFRQQIGDVLFQHHKVLEDDGNFLLLGGQLVVANLVPLLQPLREIYIP